MLRGETCLFFRIFPRVVVRRFQSSRGRQPIAKRPLLSPGHWPKRLLQASSTPPGVGETRAPPAVEPVGGTELARSSDRRLCPQSSRRGQTRRPVRECQRHVGGAFLKTLCIPCVNISVTANIVLQTSVWRLLHNHAEPRFEALAGHWRSVARFRALLKPCRGCDKFLPCSSVIVSRIAGAAESWLGF